MALLVDSGILFALMDRTDSWHERARQYLERNRELLLVPATVLPETAFLLRRSGGPERELLVVSAVSRGELAVETLAGDDYRRTGELMTDYPEIGFVDSSVVAIAERLNLTRLLTTDRRHFAYIRPRHVPALTLLP